MGKYLSGIIEGFFGRPWSWPERRMAVDFLADQAHNAFIYAPKSDTYLRRRWQEPWPQAEFTELEAFADYCRGQGIQWGVGLSPYEAYVGYGAATRASLQAKVAEINALKPTVLCVLFDDMRGDVPGLAEVQVAMVEDIAAASDADRLVMCPTYYSEDPMLERVFGARPEGYWPQLGSQLDQSIDFFWTGQRVCSTGYSAATLATISDMMGRAPVLWDNYPVNDGEKMCRRLHLRPFSERPGANPGWLRGHLVNPMNQAHLSRLVLASLPSNRQILPSFADAARRYCPAGLAKLLARDCELFSDKGLDGIEASRVDELVAQYGSFDDPCAREVVGWLRGEYAFDPACLTDA